MRVINLAGGPGSGKSTTAAGLFNLMKLSGFKVELVTEVAKDLTYDEAFAVRANQLLVFAEQEHRIRRLAKAGIEWVITDSPLFIGLAYADNRQFGTWFENLTYEVMSLYDNKFYFMNRVKPYGAYGRDQTEDEARMLDEKTLFLTELFSAGNFARIDGDELAAITIFTDMFPIELSALTVAKSTPLMPPTWTVTPLLEARP